MWVVVRAIISGNEAVGPPSVVEPGPVLDLTYSVFMGNADAPERQEPRWCGVSRSRRALRKRIIEMNGTMPIAIMISPYQGSFIVEASMIGMAVNIPAPSAPPMSPHA